jgi:hypothetical protein
MVSRLFVTKREGVADPMADAVIFRTNPDAPVPLPMGLKTVQSIHDLLRTSADTVDKGPRLLYEGRRSERVSSFLNHVLLEAAGPGSYELIARLPSQELGQQTLDDAEEFSGRAVALRLNEALRAARTAAGLVLSGRGRDRHDVFYDHVEQGVSANLCTALGDLGGPSRDQAFEIGFSWAALGIGGRLPARPVAFTGEMSGVLGRAGEELQVLAKSKNGRITGRVEELRHREGEEPQVRVRGDLCAGPRARFERRALWVAVNSGQYEEAIEAHRRRWMLAIDGRVSIGGRRLELRVSEFQVIR